MMSKSKSKNLVRNEYGSKNPSEVVGVRADSAIWERVTAAARKEGLTRNGVVVKAIIAYLEGGNGGK